MLSLRHKLFDSIITTILRLHHHSFLLRRPWMFSKLFLGKRWPRNKSIFLVWEWCATNASNCVLTFSCRKCVCFCVCDTKNFPRHLDNSRFVLESSRNAHETYVEQRIFFHLLAQIRNLKKRVFVFWLHLVSYFLSCATTFKEARSFVQKSSNDWFTFWCQALF